MMTWWEGVLLAFGLVGSTLYSGIETGVVSINRLRLHHLVRQKTRGADVLERFLDEPDHLLGTTLVGNNLANVCVSIVSASLAVALFGTAGPWIATLGTTVVLLIFGEYLPKTWFRADPAYRTLPFTRFLAVSGMVFYPLSLGVTRLARLVIPGPAGGGDVAPAFITREELQYLTQESEKSGALSSAERRMMHGVMQLTHKTCADVMRPREAIVRVHPGMPVAEALALARQQQVSRLPIYDEKQEKFTGLVHIMDLLPAEAEAGRVVKEFARPPQYVAGDAPVDLLLTRMRLSRQPMALVRDAQERVVGLVTLEDVLEEIVGQL
jgi:putative hemolysin